MKTAVLVAVLLSVALSAVMRRDDTDVEIIACTMEFSPVCDTNNTIYGNNCSLSTTSGAQYDPTRCYNWQKGICELIPETGCVLPVMIE